MSTPTGITRVPCTIGTFSTVESGADLGAEITITASAPTLVWAATGEALFADPYLVTVQPGATVNLPLIPTDLTGWLIGGAAVDVTDGKQSHTYTIKVQPTVTVGAGKVRKAGAPVTYTRVAVPSSTVGTIDLDKSVSITGPTGTVTVPNLTGPQGPPGFNATGAAQDAQALADFTNQTAGPNPFATALSATYAKGATATIVIAPFDNASPDRADITCDGTDDQIVINAALASLEETGGRVFLRGGTFNTSGAIVIRQQHVSLEGEGWGFWADFTSNPPGVGLKGGGLEGPGITKIKRTTSSTEAMIYVDNTTQDPRLQGISIRNLYLFGGTTATYGIYCFDTDRPSDQLRIEKVFVHRATTAGMKIYADAPHILSNTIMDCEGDSIILGGYFGLIADNVIADNGGHGVVISSLALGNPMVRGNTICRVNKGVLLQGAAQVYGNNIDQTVSHGIHVQGAGKSTILGNRAFLSGGACLVMEGGNDTLVSDNYFRAATAECVYIDQTSSFTFTGNRVLVESTTSGGVTVLGSAFFTMTGNLISKSAGVANSARGLYVDTSDVFVITGNLVAQPNGGTFATPYLVVGAPGASKVYANNL